jgi:hypothetical protein
MIVKELDLEILLNLHIFSSPEYDKTVFGILSACTPHWHLNSWILFIFDI